MVEWGNMEKENKNLAESNQDPFQTKEDLFQKSLHQGADFYKGLERHEYKNVWSFFFAALTTLFVFFIGCLALSILLAGAIEAIKQKSASFIAGAILISFVTILIYFIFFRLLRKMIRTFRKKDKDFKKKAALLLIIPIALFIIIFAALFPVIFSMDIIF